MGGWGGRREFGGSGTGEGAAHFCGWVGWQDRTVVWGVGVVEIGDVYGGSKSVRRLGVGCEAGNWKELKGELKVVSAVISVVLGGGG